MSELHEGGYYTGPGLRTQLNSKSLHKFEATSREQFEELMKVMNHLQEETKRENKLKDELRNVKGPKKKLAWKKE